MELSFEELRKVLAAEKGDVALQSLASDFYAQYAQLLTMQRAELQTSFSHDTNTRYQNNLKLFKELAERRESKIVMKALRDAKTGNVSGDGLCPHESSLYSSVLRDCLGARQAFEDVSAGKTVTLSPPSTATMAVANSSDHASLSTVTTSSGVSVAAAASRRVHVLVDVPEFVSPSGMTVGPLKSGQVVELQDDSASLLIRRQAARDA